MTLMSNDNMNRLNKARSFNTPVVSKETKELHKTVNTLGSPSRDKAANKKIKGAQIF